MLFLFSKWNLRPKTIGLTIFKHLLFSLIWRSSNQNDLSQMPECLIQQRNRTLPFNLSWTTLCSIAIILMNRNQCSKIIRYVNKLIYFQWWLFVIANAKNNGFDCVESANKRMKCTALVLFRFCVNCKCYVIFIITCKLKIV